MDKFIEFSPWLIVILLFLWQNKIFVTPEVMEKRFAEFEQHIEKKFVLQQTHEIAITEIKADITEIKEQFDRFNAKLDSIHEILIKG